MKNLQKGFIVPLILAIIAILIVGGGAYVYLNKKTQIFWKTYTSEKYGFEFKYPQNLSIITESTGEGNYDGDRFYIQGLVSDPNNIPRLLEVSYPTTSTNTQAFTDTQELIDYIERNSPLPPGIEIGPDNKIIEKDFFNLGKAIIYNYPVICGSFKQIAHEGYIFYFYSDPRCPYDQQITGILNTFRFTK